MPIDFKSILDTQAWSLLEADSDFNSAAGFPVGCRMKDDPRASVQRKAFRAPADFRKISIEVQDCTDAAGTPLTFGMNSVTYTPSVVDVVKPQTAKVVVTMTFDVKSAKADRFAAQSIVRRVWNKAYPKFGLSYVGTFAVNEITRPQRANQGQPERIVVTQTLTFNLRPMLSQLV